MAFEKISDRSFLGTGWSFPPTFSKAQKNVAMVSNEEDIRQSLWILFSTRLGERIMQPTYGCELTELLFEPINTTLQTYISDRIRTAILYFEPRIRLNDVEIDLDEELEGRVNITIDYTIKATNSRFNFVYPFYLNEGTEILNL